MRLAKIQFHKLDKDYDFLPEFSQSDSHQLKAGDYVIVETVLGQDIGQVLSIADYQDKPGDAQVKDFGEIKPILRPVEAHDLEQSQKNKANYSKYLELGHQLSHKHGLKEMKIIDVSESFDGSRLTFYFIANTRVDFRELVKDLVAAMHKKIRLQQVGVRDAAKAEGDFGPCGLALCCRSWLHSLGNVNPDLIKNQSLAHRGVDRLTGVCGRLKCCLRFEEENYRWQEGGLPQIGDVINTRSGPGKVVAVYLEKKTVDLEINGQLVEYPYTGGKNCQVVQD